MLVKVFVRACLARFFSSEAKNFDLKAKNSSEMALQRWRKLYWVVKNKKRRFRFTAILHKRSEAETIRRTNQEKFRQAVLVSNAALQFIQGLDRREIVYRRGPGCNPKSR